MYTNIALILGFTLHISIQLNQTKEYIAYFQMMNVIFSSLIFVSLLLLKHGVAAGEITVTEVPAGHLAELPCLSSDDHHRFMFWQLTDDKRIIGPGNFMDENKYNYEVLTGKLYIRGVSTAESGFYKCVSKGIADHSSINIHVVELIVKKDWEDVWENDFETNLLRGMAAVMVVVVVIAVVLFIITAKRKQNRRFFDLEESRENSPVKYTPNTSGRPNVPTPIAEESGIDNSALDIDFPRVFKQMQK
ncbi:uncharacterized protein LOC117221138 isoform X1 [Megalopta genalis]|uniref:uncharacterized protein LOC117221138 isoform X1 n=2 Tax=Megalopta genalis TaxID=115081 RepID=UPI0014437059|nr:uncharacterized protein LOC117221138 isoform X1 [Megalopta genalis]